MAAKKVNGMTVKGSGPKTPDEHPTKQECLDVLTRAVALGQVSIEEVITIFHAALPARPSENSSTGQEAVQTYEEKQGFIAELRDLQDTADVEMYSLRTLVELGFKAGEDYTSLPTHEKLKSMGIFIDWQGLLILMRERIAVIHEAIRAMDDIIV
jgi:hypothetical protein